MAGDYYWIVQYTGDANNEGAIGVCPDAAELVTVPPATPTLATQASPPAGPLGVSTQDTATVSGGVGLTGTVTFQLFGPADPACAGTPIATFRRRAFIDGDGDLATGHGPSRRYRPTGGDLQRRREQRAGDRRLRRIRRNRPPSLRRRTAGPGKLRTGSSEDESSGTVHRRPARHLVLDTFTIWFGPFDPAVAVTLLGTLLTVGSRSPPAIPRK